MATRLYEHPIFLEHITPEGHPSGRIVYGR